MPGICNGRVVIVTGAGNGIGRGYALEFARQGAKVVVNDYGGARDGTQKGISKVASSQIEKAGSVQPADAVVAEIVAMGGEAVANYGNVADWKDGEAMVQQAVSTFGDLHAVVCNAGILRDRTLVNMTEGDWDAVSAVHLKGSFVPAHFAAQYWRDRCKKIGGATDGRLIFTSSTSGLYANPGQTNYAAAKAGLAMYAVTAAKELARYGVTVNAIAPGAMTRMTVDIMPKAASEKYKAEMQSGGTTSFGPENVAPLIVWLCSPAAKSVTGRVFGASGGQVTLYDTFRPAGVAKKKGRWDPAELGSVVEGLVAKAPKSPAHARMPPVASGPTKARL